MSAKKKQQGEAGAKAPAESPWRMPLTEPRMVPRPPGIRPIGFFQTPKDLADMTDAEIEEFVAFVCDEIRRGARGEDEECSEVDDGE